MAGVVERRTVVSTAAGPTLEGADGQDLRHWRVSAPLVAAVLAGVAAVALAVPRADQRSATRTLASHHGFQSSLATRLPINLAGPASAGIGASERSFWPVRQRGALLTRGGGIDGTFSPGGARLRVPDGNLSLSLAGVGRGRRLSPVSAVAPMSAANAIVYPHGSIHELYRNGPLGLEQTFTLRQRPQRGIGPLSLELRVTGSLIPEQKGSQVLFRTRAGITALRYGQLSVLDATGRRLPAQMLLHHRVLQLRIDDSNARYPLRVDPLIQQAELKGSGESGSGRFGYSVALSSDGSTALIGGQVDEHEIGAAWVFTRSGSTWTQQGPKVTGSEEVGTARFGKSVALSSDGNTALIGGSYDNGQIGAAWVFTRSGSTWTQQGPKVTGSGETGQGNFGEVVALSSDGNTALIGGDSDKGAIGAAWVFTRSGSSWTQQGPKLAGSGESGAGRFGESVALSSDGNTALIGGPFDGAAGATWVFTRSGSTWTQQGSKLAGGEEIGEGDFGFAVALSSDGNTALIGGGSDNGRVGAAWAFTRSGSTWTQQGPKLTGGGEVGKGDFGYALALSSDGNTALIGGDEDNNDLGAAWVLARSGSTWAQQGSKLTGGGEVGAGLFGLSVALSSDASIAIAGGANDNNSLGAAWVFAAVAPSVTKVEPSSGPAAGGTSVNITGTNLTGATAVKFGSSNAASFTVNSAASVTAVSPAGTGTVDVTVTTPEGTSATSPADRFSYGPVVTKVEPNHGPAAGGTSVTITGSDLTGATAVKFGSHGATSFTVNSSTSITAMSPAVGPSTVDVTVTTPEGTSPTSPLDQFTFGPSVTQIAPREGLVTGGTSVTITGINLSGATAVKFGPNNAASFTVNSDTSITAVSPEGSPNRVDVTVTSPDGTSPTSPADEFAYLTPPPSPPTVTRVEPNTGPAAGGTSVTLTGTNFTAVSAVRFGSTNATGYTVNSATSITAVSPAFSGGSATVDVTVTNPAGTSPITTNSTPFSESDLFLYEPAVTHIEPNSGPAVGGTTVTITGVAFSSTIKRGTPPACWVCAVKFGSTKATSFEVRSENTITAVSPAGAGTVDVTAESIAGPSPAGPADQFRYLPMVTGAAAWGGDFYGELGNGRSGYGAGSNAAIAVSGLSEVASVAAGNADSFALLKNGTVMGWGVDAVGQVGNGKAPPSGEPVNLPAAVCAQGEQAPCSQHLSNVSAIAAGEAFGLALLSNGTVMAWGTNQRGELGNGSTTGPETCVEGLIACSRAPVPVPGLSNVTAIAAGGEVALALLQSGKVMAWGRNVWGQLGNGSASEYSDVPVEVQSLSNVTAISTGGTSSLALLNSGAVVAWGDNDSGQLGIGTTTGPQQCGESACSTAPLAVSGLSGVKSLAGGWIHNLALLSNGTVMAWGNNNEGQLGDGSFVASDVPVAVSALSGATAVAAGNAHSVALLSDGTAMAWGWNSQWQLGSGLSELERSDLPVPVDGLKQATAIAAGYSHGLAIGAAGVLPAVTSVSPNRGPRTGGTSVKLQGSHFTGATAVKFGTTNASSFTVNSETSITAVSPAGLGAVHVTVVTPEGTSITTSADEFLYELPTVTADRTRRRAKRRRHLGDNHRHQPRRSHSRALRPHECDQLYGQLRNLDHGRRAAFKPGHRGCKGHDAGRHERHERGRPVHLQPGCVRTQRSQLLPDRQRRRTSQRPRSRGNNGDDHGQAVLRGRLLQPGLARDQSHVRLEGSNQLHPELSNLDHRRCPRGYEHGRCDRARAWHEPCQLRRSVHVSSGPGCPCRRGRSGSCRCGLGDHERDSESERRGSQRVQVRIRHDDRLRLKRPVHALAGFGYKRCRGVRDGHGARHGHHLPLQGVGDQRGRNEPGAGPDLHNAAERLDGRDRSGVGHHTDLGKPECHREPQRDKCQRMHVRIRHDQRLRLKRPVHALAGIGHERGRGIRGDDEPDHQHHLPLQDLCDECRRHEQRS